MKYLSSDLPVIISVCAGQLWTIGKIEMLAKAWVLQIFDWLLPFVWPLPFEWLLPFEWPLPNLTPNFSYNLRALGIIIQYKNAGLESSLIRVYSHQESPIVNLLWSGPKAKKYIVAIFSCFGSFTHHTVSSGPNQNAVTWQHPLHLLARCVFERIP